METEEPRIAAEPAGDPRREKIVVAAVIGAATVFLLATIRAGHGWQDDFALYISHAQNLLSEKAYADTGYLYNITSPFSGPRTYPPIFPLLIAPVVKAFGVSLYALKVEIVLALAGSLALVFASLRRHGSFVVAASVVALLGFSPFFWDFKDNVLSDIPFLGFVVLSLITMDRLGSAQPDERSRSAQPDGVGRSAQSLRWGLLCGGAMYLAVGTRTIGIVLVPALLVTELVRRRRISRAAVIASAVVLVASAVQALLIPGGESYADDLALLTPRLVVTNAWRYLRALERVAFNGVSMPLAHVFFAGLAVLAIVGFVSRLRRDRFSPVEAFVPLYLTAVVAWPVYQDTRLLIPVIPFFLAYVLGGVGALAPARIRRPALVALGVAFAFSYVTLFARLDFGPIREGVEKPATREAFAWIRDNTAPGDVVAFRRPKALALLAERPSFGHGPGRTDAQQLGDFERMGADYLLTSHLDPAYLGVFVRRNESRFERVFGNSEYVLYRFRRA